MNFPKIINFLKRINYILIAAWVIPAAVLLTILYLNFLPFGYQKTLTINVGSKNDDKGEFRLEPSQFLGARQELDGKTFRYLDGLAYAVYEPKVVLRNATIEAELTASSGVSFILPPDLSNVKWDYDWNAKNIEKDFKIELSEKQLFNKFQNTESIPLTAAIPLLRGVSCTQDGVCEACQKDELCYKDGWALELQYQSNEYATLLTGDIQLSQTPKELILKYKKQTLKYPLPDYFLGDIRTIIIASDNENLYLTTDKNDTSTKIQSLVIAPACKSPLERGVAQYSATGCVIPAITTSKTLAVLTAKFHPTKPSFIDTKDDSIALDGSTRLTMPNTADKFEDGPFTVYAEWTPEKAANGQQIIGHFNWEIWQNEKTVSFQVGRMSTSTGQMYKISYNIDETFFNKPHTLLAVYSPISTSSLVILNEAKRSEGSDTSTTTQTINGYIELFVDGVFAGREYFANETIWKGYGNQNLSLGWTPHNYSKNPNFQGIINQIKLANTPPIGLKKSNSLIFSPNTETIKIPFYGTGEFTEIKIKTKK